MPGETITIQVGQCGNQVGLEYWNQLASEHGINPDGTAISYTDAIENEYEFQPINGNTLHPQQSHHLSNSQQQQSDRKDQPNLFFSLSDSNTYTPRAILVDLDFPVVKKCTNSLPMFNPRNIHYSNTPAGNIWQRGYRYGTRHESELLDLIDREVDKCDNLANFQLIHSVAGGTGSGVGSKLLELLSDRYGNKKVLSTFSVFPLNEKSSDVVVQPYNTVLTLRSLIEYSHATFVFDNDALSSIDNISYDYSKRGFESINKLIAYATASISNPMRFPRYMYTSFDSIIPALIPVPDLKFLTTSIVPMSQQKHSSLNEYDMILELSNDKYKSNRVPADVHYLSTLNYLIGDDLNRQEIQKGIAKAQQRTPFVPWMTRSVHVIECKQSPFIKRSGGTNSRNLGGIQVSNNTSISDVFTKLLDQYDRFFRRKAYVNKYVENNSAEEQSRIIDMFNEGREAVADVVQEYDACKRPSYLDNSGEEEDQSMY
ncbi:TUB4 [[Candida] subhashii]|uniref:Tubulin gamma chain n=1 Tax=[Candida] subhashii TaxID=561895 RepID=A0A8J5QI47_9ASCO|nr:TUB4 [[Candida] subhashii]KAG7661755.1 TUB4 [[Candida] subhashii]